MPIRPEMRALYPQDWPAISRACKERAGWKCERCDVAHGAVGYRVGGEWHQLGESIDAAGLAIDAATEDGHHVIKIVLTTAHVHDPDPANCADDNLQALCQRCHNLLDQPMRQANARQTRRARKATADMFEESA